MLWSFSSWGNSIFSQNVLWGVVYRQDGVRRCIYSAALCSEGTPSSGGDTTVSVSALSKIGTQQPHTVIPQRFKDNETPIPG